MEEKCCGCGKPFAAGDHVVTFRMERVLRGERSNILGFYKSTLIRDNVSVLYGSEGPEDGIDHVHFTPGCLERTFSPIENPFMYDMLADEVRQRIYDEESEMDPAEILPELPELIENPPMCLWCKKTNTVWMHVDKGYPIYNCLACRKLWDHEEDELYWDPEKGDYFLVK